MTRARHGTVSQKAEKLVWAKAAGRCQFENCNVDLTQHLVAGNRNANRGYNAHIIGASDGGPRGDETHSKAQAKNPDNVMLLCDGCHREIDREHPTDYPAARLFEMKRLHEAWVARAVGLGRNSQSHILSFTNQIGSNETAVPIVDCIAAMRAIGKTPASADAIDLKLGVSARPETDDVYWAVEPVDLENFFHRRLEGFFNTGKIRHLSVFGYAPMPLLIKLGQLLPDIHDVEVFSRHREPTPSWAWQGTRSDLSPFLSEGERGSTLVALKLAITDRIADKRVRSALDGDRVSIWEIGCKSPGHGALKTREDLSAYRTVIRAAFNRIKEVHGERAELLVFPAAPAACCIEFGRVWQPKAHLPMRIFDQVHGRGFVERLKIGYDRQQ